MSQLSQRPADPRARAADGHSIDAIRSILFVELLGGFGDLLLALPALHALARSHPGSRVTVLTFPPGASLLAMDPAVAEVLAARPGPDTGAGSPARQDLARLLAARRFDLVVSDTRHSGIHELIESALGGSARRAVTQLWQGARPDERVDRLFLRRLVEEGVVEPRRADLPLRLPVGPAEAAAAAAWWSASGLPRRATVALNPHAGMPIKRWPPGHFAALGRALRRRGRPVAVLAGEAPELAAGLAGEIPGAVVVPPASLRALAGLLAGLGALVSADTGPARLAAAVGTPVVGIFGPTWAGRYGHPPPGADLQSPVDCPERRPLDFTRQSCWYSGRCVFPDKRNCCEDVSPAAVAAAVEDVLAATGHPAALPTAPAGSAGEERP